MGTSKKKKNKFDPITIIFFAGILFSLLTVFYKSNTFNNLKKLNFNMTTTAQRTSSTFSDKLGYMLNDVAVELPDTASDCKYVLKGSGIYGKLMDNKLEIQYINTTDTLEKVKQLCVYYLGADYASVITTTFDTVDTTKDYYVVTLVKSTNTLSIS